MKKFSPTPFLLSVISNTVTITISLIGFTQDFLGKEGYIQYINNHWIDIPWGFWFFPAICGVAGLYINERTIREHLK